VTLGVFLLAFLTAQRLGELAWAARNTSRLLAEGGIEFGRGHYPLLVILHAAWLLGLWVLASGHPVDLAYLAAFLLLQLGRLWVLASLGPRWTTRIVVISGTSLVATGPYRLLRHPNYLIVTGEILVVPLAFDLPGFAAFFLCSMRSSWQYAFARRTRRLPGRQGRRLGLARIEVSQPGRIDHKWDDARRH
jgi:methyltransferase